MSRGRKSKKDHLLTALKQAILQQAIQGKLTADWRVENPNAEPASELLKRIKAEKQKLIDEKKIRKEKPLPAISAAEIPFDLPDGWVWCRLGEICNQFLGGFAFKSSKYVKYSNNQVIRLGNVKNNKLELGTNPVYISDEYAGESKKAKLLPNDILITMTGTRAKRDYLFTLLLNNKSFIVKDLYLNQRVGCFRFNLNLNLEFVNHLLKELSLIEPVFLSSTGAVNQANIGITALYKILIPLPPLPEQTAIVQKVEALMQKCDALEKGESIQHFPAIDEPADQLLNRYAVGRQLLAELPQQQTQVKQLKQAILQEAIQGKLTADWRAENPDAEPASELLKRIKAEKQKLIDEKKIRKEKPLPAISAEEIPFDLPDGWVWCRLGEVIRNTDNLNIQKELHLDTLINYVDIDSIDNKRQIIKEPKIQKVRDLSSRARRVLRKGFIMYSLVRPYLHNLAIVDNDKDNYIGSTGFSVFDCISIENKYIFWLLLSKYVEEIYLQFMDGFNSPSITHDQFRFTLIPLPPLQEQTAIVQKVEALMQTCIDLETQIKQSETHATQLMQAVIKEAFETEKASATP